MAQPKTDGEYLQILKAKGKTIVLNGKDALGYVVYYPDEVMTGQEWYERFSDELDSWAATANTGDCNAVLLAAKKASSSEGTSGL